MKKESEKKMKIGEKKVVNGEEKMMTEEGMMTKEQLTRELILHTTISSIQRFAYDFFQKVFLKNNQYPILTTKQRDEIFLTLKHKIKSHMASIEIDKMYRALAEREKENEKI